MHNKRNSHKRKKSNFSRHVVAESLLLSQRLSAIKGKLKIQLQLEREMNFFQSKSIRKLSTFHEMMEYLRRRRFFHSSVTMAKRNLFLNFLIFINSKVSDGENIKREILLRLGIKMLEKRFEMFLS